MCLHYINRVTNSTYQSIYSTFTVWLTKCLHHIYRVTSNAYQSVYTIFTEWLMILTKVSTPYLQSKWLSITKCLLHIYRATSQWLSCTGSIWGYIFQSRCSAKGGKIRQTGCQLIYFNLNSHLKIHKLINSLDLSSTYLNILMNKKIQIIEISL